jgi:calcium-dependent protein kinase
VSKEAQDFINVCLIKDYTKRPQVSDLIHHPWIKMVEEQKLDDTVALNIGKSLIEFRNTTAFQTGVIAFIANVTSGQNELRDLEIMFNRIDTSKDGKLSLDELSKGIEELQAFFQFEDIDYEDLLKKMDADGDGEIDFSEFITAAFNTRTLLTQENLDAAFKTFDKDGNGKITKDELQAIFSGGEASKASDAVWKDIMDEVDKNGDGEIDYEEFTSAMRIVMTRRATDAKQKKK